MNIVVLAGGLSTERDVSLKSGDMIAAALRRKGHRAILLDVFMGVEDIPDGDYKGAFDKSEELSVVVGDIPTEEPDLDAVRASRPDGNEVFFGPNVIDLCRASDIVFMALHGADGENGKIQAAFDLYGIKYTGNGYLPSAIAMDKGISKQFFSRFDIPAPQGFTMKKISFKPGVTLSEDHFPCVVKPACGGSSIGVYIVRNSDEYEKALEDAFRYEDEVLVEDYIEGREFSVGVLDSVALPVIEIAPKSGFYDYKNKYKAGLTTETCPAELDDETTSQMQLYAERVVVALGLKIYSRMDFMLTEDGRIYCLEANTLPGMTPTSLLPQEAQAIGISYEDLCEEILQISMEKYES